MSAYRPDVDGLRALAVLPVVLFHAGVPGFSGGFVGVDIFFVISGYLLTGIIQREIEVGNFSLAGFYVRRARRILPALALVVAVCVVTGFYLLSPTEYAQLGYAAQSVATIRSNNFFAEIQSDYWSQSTLAEQPLLHTWSLSVEEQFYVCLPLLIWGVHAAVSRLRLPGRAAVATILLALALISLATSQYLVAGDKATSFYHLVSRAWELLAGGLLAIHHLRHDSRATQRSLLFLASGAAGLLLVAVAVFLFDEKMEFPGLAAIVPCAGAVLLIHAGRASSNAVTRFMSTRWLVVTGMMSYSIYLWHWPVIVFSRSVGWQAWNLPDLGIPLALLVIVLLSFLSWKYFEAPLRANKVWDVSRLVGLGLGVVILAAIFLFGWLAVSIATDSRPVSQTLPVVLSRLVLDSKLTPGLRCEGSADMAESRRTGGGCLVGVTSKAPTLAILGDSHARMLTEAADTLGKETDSAVLMLARSSCVPGVGLVPPTRAECAGLTEASVDYLVRSGIPAVVLAGYWIDIAPTRGKADELAVALGETVGRLRAAGKRVYLMKDVPELKDDGFARRAALRSIRTRGKEIAGPSLADHRSHQADISRRLDAIAARSGSFILDPAQLLCHEETGCAVARDGRALYRDKHHLTDAASIEVRSVLLPALKPGGAGG